MCAKLAPVGSIDNIQWVQDNEQYLDSKDVGKTFAYVRRYHPMSGCAHAVMPELTCKEDIKELAKLANAVTVACVEVSGRDKGVVELSQMSQLNTTAVGNMAYIALNHSDEEVRKHYIDVLDRWKLFKTMISDPNNTPVESISSQ